MRQVRALSDRRSHINVEEFPAGGDCDVQKVLAEYATLNCVGYGPALDTLIRAVRCQRSELREVDITARDDRDNLSVTGAPG